MSEIENLIVDSAEVAPVEAAQVDVAPVEAAQVDVAPVEASVSTGGKKKSKKKILSLDTSVGELGDGSIQLNDDSGMPKTPAISKKSRAKKPASVANADSAVVAANGDSAVVAADGEKPLESKTLSELKDQCKLLEIKGFSKKNKADLIALIKSKSV